MNRHSEKTRARILLAAADIFPERGFRATTVRDICAQAEANIAAINYHFGSKENLYVETYRFVFADADALTLTRRALTIRNAEEWRQALYHWTHSLLDQVTNPKRSHVWQRRMFSRERTDPSQVLPMLLREFFLPIRERLSQILRLALPEDAPPVVVHTWCVNLVAQCTVYAQRDPPWDALLFPADITREEWLKLMAQHIVGSVTTRLTFRCPGNLPGITPPKEEKPAPVNPVIA